MRGSNRSSIVLRIRNRKIIVSHSSWSAFMLNQAIRMVMLMLMPLRSVIVLMLASPENVVVTMAFTCTMTVALFAVIVPMSFLSMLVIVAMFFLSVSVSMFFSSRFTVAVAMVVTSKQRV